MKIFLFGSKSTRIPVIFSEFNCVLNFNFDELNAYQQEQQEEISIHLIFDKEDELKNADLIAIELKNNHEDLCFNIGHRLRFTEATRSLPIIFFGKKNIIEIMKRDPFLSIILFTKGTAYLESTENSEDIKSTFTRLQSEASKFLDFNDFDESFLKKIRIPEPDDLGRHSIANQWGAFRFAQVADLELASLEFSPRLFFQYLTVGLQENEIRKKIKEEQEKRTKVIIEANNNIPQNVIPKVNRALLIDDNHDKGWSLVLSRLFSKWNENTETCLDTYKSYSSECQTALINRDYDFVLLDFYFGENDTKGKGLDTLKAIKEINPVLPVIMFTASNKAWNMDALYEAGADGFYIKEHPDTASDVVFSVNNYHSFIKTIDDCIEKGKLLKPYWRALHRINSNHILQEKDLGNDVWSKFGGTEGRISERIKMFIGLLKKAYEQSNFDKDTFFYSDYELAFLTLWSVLNELQEARFEKSATVSFLNENNQVINRHPNGSRFMLRSFLNWKMRSNGLYFISCQPDRINSGFVENPNGFFILKRKTNFFLRDTGFCLEDQYYDIDPKFNYEKILKMQIAFLIKCENAENSLKEKLLADLDNLNDDVRNRLFLTHGDETHNPNYSVLYKDSRLDKDTWLKHVKNLFSIVYFLCTAKEWNPSN